MDACACARPLRRVTVGPLEAFVNVSTASTVGLCAWPSGGCPQRRMAGVRQAHNLVFRTVMAWGQNRSNGRSCCCAMVAMGWACSTAADESGLPAMCVVARDLSGCPARSYRAGTRVDEEMPSVSWQAGATIPLESQLSLSIQVEMSWRCARPRTLACHGVTLCGLDLTENVEINPPTGAMVLTHSTARAARSSLPYLGWMRATSISGSGSGDRSSASGA